MEAIAGLVRILPPISHGITKRASLAEKHGRRRVQTSLVLGGPGMDQTQCRERGGLRVVIAYVLGYFALLFCCCALVGATRTRRRAVRSSRAGGRRPCSHPGPERRVAETASSPDRDRALGKTDPDAEIERLERDRAPLDDFARIRGYSG